MAIAHHVGAARNRVDGPLKVTGRATYAAEFDAPDLAYGVVVSGAVAKGRIHRIDDAAARAAPGVIKIFTHENRPRTAWFSSSYQDQVAPPGSPFRPLNDATIVYSGQPVALVVAESYEAARDAASLLRIEYDALPHLTDLEAKRSEAYVPPKKRSGIQPPPKARGDAKAAFDAAPIKIDSEYYCGTEHHNPMEPHATTVVIGADGKYTVHDKTQGVMNSLAYVTSVFGLSQSDVRVVSPFVGGAFGSGLRPQYHCSWR